MRRQTISICILILALLPLPVKAEIIARHTLIKGTMLEFSDIQEENLTPEEYELFEEVYLGQSVTRMIYANREILKSYICEPEIVKRNSLVQMVYKIGMLQIKTQGRALDSGASGEIVSVMNLTSRQIVQGEIIGPDLVQLF